MTIEQSRTVQSLDPWSFRQPKRATERDDLAGELGHVGIRGICSMHRRSSTILSSTNHPQLIESDAGCSPTEFLA
jgi:hypothetical protein